MELVVRVNGGHAAYMSYYGRDSQRDRVLRADAFRSANTSASVIVRDEQSGALLLHLLFDVGLGVVNRLEAARPGTGAVKLDALFLTHPHLDHYAELDRLAFGLLGARRLAGEHHWKLPMYCTTPCAEQVIGERGSFAWLAAQRKGPVQHHPVVPCEPVTFAIGGGDAVVSVTPVSVYHGPFAPGAVIYVVEALGKKVIFGWDVLRLVEAPDEPNQVERETFTTALPAEQADLVRDADVLFLDSTTWHPRPNMGHISIVEGLALAESWRAQRLYWTHYSGNEDMYAKTPALNPTVDLPGIRIARPLTDPELHWLAGRVSHILDRDVRLAYPGMTLPDTEDWPGAWPPPFI